MTSPLAGIFEHHVWSNLRIVDFCATLDDDQLGLTVPGVFGSVLQTIKHVLANEAHYLTFLEGCPQVEQLSQRAPFTGWPHVRSIAEGNGQALIGFVTALEDDPVQRGRFNDEPYEMATSVLLAQIINHTTEHRSHIRTQLSAHGIVPPEIDLWHYLERDSNED